MDKQKVKQKQRWRRHRRVRRRVEGSAERPRLTVFRSARHIYTQVIDDWAGRTLVAASTLDKDAADVAATSRPESATWVGQRIAEKAIEQGIGQVSFDRGGYRYHGRVKALAEGARKAGLKF